MKKENGITIFEQSNKSINPAHTCLVVWDVQNGLVDRIFNKEEFIGKTKKLIESLRGKIPIVYTLITPVAKEYQSSWQVYSMMRRFNVKEYSQIPNFMAPGSIEREIPEVVKPSQGDIILEKPTASIFIGTNFENMMHNKGITTLLFAGIATEIGIESSARDASHRGFFPVVISDCVSSMDQEAHERSLKNLEKIAIVKSSAEII